MGNSLSSLADRNQNSDPISDMEPFLRPHATVFMRMMEYVGECKNNDTPVGCAFALEKTDDPDPEKKWKMTYSCHPAFVNQARELAEQMTASLSEQYNNSSPEVQEDMEAHGEKPMIDEMLHDSSRD